MGWRSRGALNARNARNGTRAVLIFNVKLFRGALRSSTFAMHGINAKLFCLASKIKEILNKGELIQCIAAWSQESQYLYRLASIGIARCLEYVQTGLQYQRRERKLSILSAYSKDEGESNNTLTSTIDK